MDLIQLVARGAREAGNPAPPIQYFTCTKREPIDWSCIKCYDFYEKECIVCYEDKAEMLFSCGHIVCCKKCDINIHKCPVCREDILDRKLITNFNKPP
jgi:hypothetical protein